MASVSRKSVLWLFSDDELRGQRLVSVSHMGPLWKLAIDQALAIGAPVPMTYEWARDGIWHIRTALVVPELSGGVTIYITDRGMRCGEGSGFSAD